MSAFPIPSTTNKPSLVRYTSPTHGELFSLCLGEVTTLKQAEDYSFRNSVRDWQIPVGSEATLIYKPAELEHLAEGMRICYHYSHSSPFTEEYLTFLNGERDSNQQSFEKYSSELQITALKFMKAYTDGRMVFSEEGMLFDGNRIDPRKRDAYGNLLFTARLTDRFAEASEIVSHVLNGGSLLYLVQLEIVKAQKGQGLAKNLIDSFHQIASGTGIDKTYSIVDKSNSFKPAMAHLFHNSGYRGIDSNWDREEYTDPFTFYIKGLNHLRVSAQHE